MKREPNTEYAWVIEHPKKPGKYLSGTMDSSRWSSDLASAWKYDTKYWASQITMGIPRKVRARWERV